MDKADGPGIRTVVLNHVSRDARLLTDESPKYTNVGKMYLGGHEFTKHSIHEYARGDVHTNSIEGFFSLLKRGIYGTFHSVSKKHLHRYLAEFAYRYNTRDVDDGERVVRALKRAQFKRLTYRGQVGS